MEGWEDRVKAAISNPTLNLIFQDSQLPSRNIYYRKQPGVDYYLKVVVDFSQGDVGRVLTAFPTDSRKPGEKWIWPPSSD